MKRFMQLVVMACAFMLIGPQRVEAQGKAASQTQGEEEAACKECKHNLGTNEHWFGGWFSGCTSGSDCYDCHAFNACHDGPQAPYQCGAYHWLCGATGAMLDAVDKALASPGVESAITRVANSAPKAVRIIAGGYVVVKNCNGAIVAAFKLPKPRSPKAPLAVAARTVVLAGFSRQG